MDGKKLRIGACIAAISAAGPLGIDMYLGALPLMARDLGGGAGEMQQSVMTFFLGFTLGQLFYGPASDRLGRKPIVYFGLAVYCLGSIGCALAGSVPALLAWRLAQGLGGSIGMVIGTAIVRDLYTGDEAVKMMSVVVAIMGIAPCLAPLAGSLILGAAGWRMIFAALAVFSVAAALTTLRFLPETRVPGADAGIGPSRIIGRYAALATSGKFLPYAAAMALAQGGFFAYVGGSSFALINVHGLTPLAYSLAFGLNVIGLSIGSAASTRLARRHGFAAVAGASSAVLAAAAATLALLNLHGPSSLWTLCALLFATVTAIGGILPVCTVLAMAAHGNIAGTAAALLGALGFGAGAAATVVMGVFADGGVFPMLATIAVCGLASAFVAIFLFPRPAADAGGGGAHP